MTRRYGQVVNVNVDEVGSALVADTAAGAGTLTVKDAADFDGKRGGTLSINGQVIAFIKADDDTGIITLDGSLHADADEGDQVAVYDTKRRVVVVEKTALVDVGEGKSDAMHTTVAAHLVRKLPEGPRGDDGEAVVIERDEDGDWTLIDVLGLGDDGANDEQWEADDAYTLTADDVDPAKNPTYPNVTMPLSHRPRNESVDAKWNGIGQAATEYTVNYDDQTVTWPLEGFEQVGDLLLFHYEYLPGISTPRVVSGASVVAVNSGPDAYGNPSLVPVAAAAGDAVILAVLVPDGETVTGNGYTLVTQTAVVEHAAATNGPFDTRWRYKLQVWVGVKGAPVPTISGNAGGNPWVSVAYPAGSSVGGSAVATVADGTSAPAPALTDGNLRIWANVGNFAYIVAPSSSTVHAGVGIGDVQVLVATDTTPSAVVANSGSISAGWMTATLSVTG